MSSFEDNLSTIRQIADEIRQNLLDANLSIQNNLNTNAFGNDITINLGQNNTTGIIQNSALSNDALTFLESERYFVLNSEYNFNDSKLSVIVYGYNITEGNETDEDTDPPSQEALSAFALERNGVTYYCFKTDKGNSSLKLIVENTPYFCELAE